MTDTSPRRHMPVRYVVLLAVGMVVGAGIFKSPALVAANAGTEAALYGVWLVAGAISLLGALCYAELATAYPHPGGDYHFLRKAWGDTVGFLFAWARMAVINTGSIALLGFVIGDYLNRVVDLGAHGPALYALVSVVAITAFNLRRRTGETVADYAVTGLEVLGLVVLGLAAGWLVVTGVPPLTTEASGPVTPAGLGYALVFAMLAFGGWNEMATLSAEVKDARRGMVRALAGSVVVITALYLLANWALLRGLGMAGLAASEAPAADLMARAFGEAAGAVLAVAVAAAAVTSINTTILVGGRTTFAAAADRPALAWIGTWDAARSLPARAILVQGAISVALVVLGAVYDGFATLVDYTAPVFWLFLAGSGAAVLRLRRTDADRERPFRLPFGPLLPVLFVLTSLGMLWSALAYVQAGALFGLAVLLLGLVLAALTRGRGAAMAASSKT